MDEFDKISIAFGTVFAVIILGGSIFLAKSMADSDRKCIEAYNNRVNTHYVEVHFKNGDVKRFDKNIDIEIDSTKMFGKGQLFYSLHPSGTKIPFDIVEYAEVKEVENPN